MSAYELGIKAYNERELIEDNPFRYGTKNYYDWEEGHWDAWFEMNYPSKKGL